MNTTSTNEQKPNWLAIEDATAEAVNLIHVLAGELEDRLNGGRPVDYCDKRINEIRAVGIVSQANEVIRRLVDAVHGTPAAAR